MAASYEHFDMSRFMNRVGMDFKDQVHNWCDLKHFQFSNGYYREYADKHYSKLYMEQYYLLKFFPFYFEEAKMAYGRLMWMFDVPVLRVLSVGVGSGVDYMALREILKSKSTDTMLEYIGVDLIDWKYRNNDIDFIQCDISDLDKRYFEGVNLVVFPKSLIELDRARLEYIAQMTAKYGADEVCFLNTYVKRGANVNGIDEFGVIDDILHQSGFVLKEGNSSDYYTVKNENLRINYPIPYNSWKNPLENFCHHNCGAEEAGRCNIAQYPMLKKTNMAFNVLKYARESK